MLKQQKQQPFVYSADGVEFTIYKTTKPAKSGRKDYWVLVDYSTGKRRLLNNKTLKAARQRADKIRAAMFKGHAHELLFSHGQMQDVYTALEALRRAKSFDSLGTVVWFWPDCTMRLGDRATPLDAVKFYLAQLHGRTYTRRRRVGVINSVSGSPTPRFHVCQTTPHPVR